jgi:hypothetical protein
VNTSTLITAGLREFDYDTSSADVTAVRTKLLDKAQEVSDEAWLHFDGDDFQQISGDTVTLAINTNSIAAPANFYKCGEGGGVFVQVAADDIRRLTYVPPGELRAKQKDNGTSTGIPEFYSIVAMDGVTDLYPEFHFDILADVAYTIPVDYVRTPPVLVDATDTTSQLQVWPVMYHTLLLKGLLARVARVMGDVSRQAQFEAEFQRGLALARSTRVHGQEDDERVGRGGYSAWRQW